MIEWEKVVHELGSMFGLKVEPRGPGGIVGIYLGYYVIATGYNCVVVYNTKCNRYEETQDIKYVIECIEKYIPIIKKWKVHFRQLALESDFK